jgi:RNA polymerase sigma-70 factor, ECF subfamily
MEQIDQIISKIQAGDSELFGDIFDNYANRIFRFILLKVSNRDDAKDILSETFLGAYQSINRYKPGKAKLSTWLFSIARRKIADYYRKNRKTISLDKVSLISNMDLASDIENKLECEKLLEKIQTLPDSLKEIIILRYVEELDYQEIAKITCKNINHIRVLCHRAVKKLKDE